MAQVELSHKTTKKQVKRLGKKLSSNVFHIHITQVSSPLPPSPLPPSHYPPSPPSTPTLSSPICPQYLHTDISHWYISMQTDTMLKNYFWVDLYSTYVFHCIQFLDMSSLRVVPIVIDYLHNTSSLTQRMRQYREGRLSNGGTWRSMQLTMTLSPISQE